MTAGVDEGSSHRNEVGPACIVYGWRAGGLMRKGNWLCWNRVLPARKRKANWPLGQKRKWPLEIVRAAAVLLAAGSLAAFLHHLAPTSMGRAPLYPEIIL